MGFVYFGKLVIGTVLTCKRRWAFSGRDCEFDRVVAQLEYDELLVPLAFSIAEDIPFAEGDRIKLLIAP